MSTPALVKDLRSKVSELELLETLNTTAFDIATHVTIGDLPDTETIGDVIKIKGKIYISVDRITNFRVGLTPS
jgi:hypothetical protein